jgi:3-methyladenine DNA glycosylase AlkC
MQVSKDEDWRVQEILAKAFDRYCADIGYEQALPVIKEWLTNSNPNVRRAVTEGLRIWTGRSYFRDHPEVAIQMLSKLRADESEYVRKSVGNAIKDISKKHNKLVQTELQGWDISKKEIKQTYKLASKFL